MIENYKQGGYNCPGNQFSKCLNKNTPYDSLEAAWKKCGEIQECKKIMLYSDGKFYLRRSTDDYANDSNKYLDYTCQGIKLP